MKLWVNEFPGSRVIVTSLASRSFIDLMKAVHIELTDKAGEIIVLELFG